MLLFAMWVEKKLAMLINSNLNEIFFFNSREIVDSMAVAREGSLAAVVRWTELEHISIWLRETLAASLAKFLELIDVLEAWLWQP